MSNDHSSQAPGQNKVHIIIVNTRPKEVTGQKISYLDVVHLAYPDGQPDANTAYTVSYSKPHGEDGILANGDEVHISEGMAFNVIKTIRS